jgi:hypothetical protein
MVMVTSPILAPTVAGTPSGIILILILAVTVSLTLVVPVRQTKVEVVVELLLGTVTTGVVIKQGLLAVPG